MKSVKKHSNRYYRMATMACVAAMMALNSVPAQALSQAYYAPSSKLASGKWVKIKTSGEGIHEITYDQLRQWGFANPEKVNVYGYGATLLASDVFSLTHPDDVALTYTRHEGDKVFFYSSGDVTLSATSASSASILRNYYSTEVFYLLSDREVGASERKNAASYDASRTNIVNTHMSLTLNEEELQNPTQCGAYFLGKNIPSGGAIDLTFDIKDMTASTAYASSTLYTNFAAYHGFPTTLSIQAPSAIKSMRTTNTPAMYAFDSYTRYKIGNTTSRFSDIIPDGSYDFSAKHPNAGQSFMAIDYAWLMYPRKNKMNDEAQLDMSFPSVNQSNIHIEANNGVHVLNITQPFNIYEHQSAYDEENGVIAVSTDRNYTSSALPTCHLVVYDPAKQQKPVEFVENVENQNLHAASTPDMLIITTADLYEAAENLADAHRQYDNMDVLVVEHTKLFNEFSSATPDAMGYRRFIKMLYDRNPSKMKYVIMYGPSHWDNRALITDKKDRLLIYETTDPLTSGVETKAFGTDCYFGMIEDSYNPLKIISTPQTIAVGRIPVTAPTEGFAINKKIINHIQSLPSATMYNTALVLSDDGDDNIHMQQAETLAVRLLENHEALTIVRAHNLVYRWDNADAKDLRSVVTSALNRGAGLFAYVGHGNEDGFGAENIWNRTFAKTTSYALKPIGLLATCTSFGFDLGKDGIGKEMLLKEDGGLIGMIAAGRVVFGMLNQDLALSAINAYAQAEEDITMGELWLKARNGLLGTDGYGEEGQVNTMCYNFGGDPALRIAVPTYKVEITRIGDWDIDNADPINMSALNTVAIEGRIVDRNGNPVDDFNGTITLQLYDAPYSVNTLSRGDGDVVEKIDLDQDILMSKIADVVDGKFSTVIMSPVPVHEDGINRLTLHADANDGRRGDGLFKRLMVQTSVEGGEEIDGNAPSIEYLAVNDPQNRNDAVVNGDVHILARGTVDRVGLNNSASIGAGSSLVIDGSRHVSGAKEAIVVKTDNTWSLSLALNDLEQGPHSVMLTIADNAGRRTSQTISFVLGNNNDIVLKADASTVRNNVTFDIEHDLGSVSESRLVIEDRFGNKIYNNRNVTFPCTVNLAATDAADGHYQAYVQVVGSEGRGSSQRLPLVLLKK